MIMENRKNDPQFILASASPRRKLLLEEAGFRFSVQPSGIDESQFSTDDIDPVEHAKQLALAKAIDVAEDFPDMLIMGVDTVVDLDGEIIGNPDDAEHAEQIIRMLFNSPHKVITAVALVRASDVIQIVRAASTTVYPKKLTEAQIKAHIKNGSWKGKAGAYGIQETGDEFVERIEGSYTNVIGLPMELIKILLPTES